MVYRVSFWTGYGIGTVAEHTINLYPLSVNADNDTEAIEKINKKRNKVSKYNSCFHENNRVIITCGDKTGILWLKENNIIKWEGERVFWFPSALNPNFINKDKFESYFKTNEGDRYNSHSFLLPKADYVQDYQRFVIQSVYPSIESMVSYIKERWTDYYEKNFT